MAEYELVRVLGRASITDYQQLFEKSYGQNSKLTTDYLRWIYEENPHGRAVGFDAYLDGELAAHYVTIPRVYQFGSENVPGLLSINTATHPNHQRRGLFTRLAAATYEQAALDGYRYVFGVANAQSIHGFLTKLEFEHVGQIRLALWRKPAKPKYEYAQINRDKEWLSWRLANPSASYFLTSDGANDVIVNARKGRTNFSIGCVDRSILPERDIQEQWRSNRGMLSLTPVFPKSGLGPFLPSSLMPSPWHIILRRLSSGLSRLSRVHFDGLSMDTF